MAHRSDGQIIGLLDHGASAPARRKHAGAAGSQPSLAAETGASGEAAAGERDNGRLLGLFDQRAVSASAREAAGEPAGPR